MRYINGQRGFTLVEMLLVLAIVVLLSTFAVRFTIKNIEQHQTEQFFKQFQQDMHYLQSYAMAHNVSVRMDIRSNGKRYLGIATSKGTILEKSTPNGYSLVQWNPYRIQYLPNGNVSTIGALTFLTPEGKRQIQVYIGKGRMRLDERIWDESS